MIAVAVSVVFVFADPPLATSHALMIPFAQFAGVSVSAVVLTFVTVEKLMPPDTGIAPACSALRYAATAGALKLAPRICGVPMLATTRNRKKSRKNPARNSTARATSFMYDPFQKGCGIVGTIFSRVKFCANHGPIHSTKQ